MSNGEVLGLFLSVLDSCKEPLRKSVVIEINKLLTHFNERLADVPAKVPLECDPVGFGTPVMKAIQCFAAGVIFTRFMVSLPPPEQAKALKFIEEMTAGLREMEMN